MNDDFLYRLRAEPPAHFAAQLKERLDRRTTRRTRVLRLGLGVLLFGTAFAMVSPTARLSVAEVIDWIRGTPAPMAEPQESTGANAGLARAPGDRKVERPDEPATAADTRAAAEQVREDARKLLESEQARRRKPPEDVPHLASPIETLADPGTPGTNATNADTSAAAGGLDTPFDLEPQSSFTVTGPLLGEYGTPAYIYDTRRACFTLMNWYMKPLNDMMKRRIPTTPKVAMTDAVRVASLMLMLPNLFAKDERDSDVPTRAKSAIWEQPGAFQAELYTFGVAVRGLLDATKSNDETLIRTRIARVNQACASCHDKFRKNGNEDLDAVTP